MIGLFSPHPSISETNETAHDEVQVRLFFWRKMASRQSRVLNQSNPKVERGGWGGLAPRATILALQPGMYWFNLVYKLGTGSEIGWIIRREHSKMGTRLLTPVRQTRNDFLTSAYLWITRHPFGNEFQPSGRTFRRTEGAP